MDVIFLVRCTTRLACEHYKTVLHGTVEFQSPCSPDLSPLDFFFLERTRNTSVSVSSSCQSLGIAGTFDPHVSQDVDRQSLDVRESGQGLGPQAKGLRCFFKFEQTWRTAAYRSKTQRKTRHQHAFDILWHSPQTQTTPQTQSTHAPIQNGAPDPQTRQEPIFTSQNPENVPQGLIFDDRAANGGKHNEKAMEPFVEKMMHVCDVHFSSG